MNEPTNLDNNAGEQSRPQIMIGGKPVHMPPMVFSDFVVPGEPRPVVVKDWKPFEMKSERPILINGVPVSIISDYSERG